MWTEEPSEKSAQGFAMRNRASNDDRAIHFAVVKSKACPKSPLSSAGVPQ
jgi:hypothetical protein